MVICIELIANCSKLIAYLTEFDQKRAFSSRIDVRKQALCINPPNLDKFRSPSTKNPPRAGAFGSPGRVRPSVCPPVRLSVRPLERTAQRPWQARTGLHAPSTKNPPRAGLQRRAAPPQAAPLIVVSYSVSFARHLTHFTPKVPQTHSISPYLAYFTPKVPQTHSV